MARQAVIVLLCLYSAVASAQSAADAKIAANALFDEGKRLLAAGNVESACPKFEASLTLLDQLGTRLNLADCYERQGKTAAAWTEFREAASRAVQRGDDRAEFARKRAEALAPRLVKLQISVSVVNQVPNLRVRRDGADIPAEAFGSPLPVNPSSYTVEASAPGYVTWSTSVDAREQGVVVVVEIPRLREAPVAAGIEPAKPDKRAGKDVRVDRGPQRKRRLLALGLGAGGVVTLGAGVGIGFAAKSKWDSASAHCDDNNACDAEGTSTNREARRLGNIGTIVGGVGVAALITGAVLYVTAPAARPVLEHAYLDVDGASAGLGFRGRF